jgi:hypothetical protein
MRISSLISSIDGYAYGELSTGPHELVVSIQNFAGGANNDGNVPTELSYEISSSFYSYSPVSTPSAVTSATTSMTANTGSEYVKESVHQSDLSTIKSEAAVAAVYDSVVLLRKGLQIIDPQPESYVSGDKVVIKIAVPYILLQFPHFKLGLIFDAARFDLTEVMWQNFDHQLDEAKVKKAASSYAAITATYGALDTVNHNQNDVPLSPSRWWSAYNERQEFSFEVGGLDMGTHTVQITCSSSAHANSEDNVPIAGMVLEFDAIRIIRMQ